MRISDWSSDVGSSDLLKKGGARKSDRTGPRCGLVRSTRPGRQEGCCTNSDPQSSSRRRGCKHGRSEEHTSELQSLMRISYAVFCLKKKKLTASYIRVHMIKQLENITPSNTSTYKKLVIENYYID